jgi:hypothetical protein
MAFVLLVQQVPKPLIEGIETTGGFQRGFFLLTKIEGHGIAEPVGGHIGQIFRGSRYATRHPLAKQPVEQIEVLLVLDQRRFAQVVKIVDCYPAYLTSQRFKQREILRQGYR